MLKDWNEAHIDGISARDNADAAWARSGLEPEGKTRASSPSLGFSAWPALDDAAFHGLAGEIMRTIEPHSEADPVAILIQVLTFFGNVIGSAPYYQVEADRHHTNLFAVLVGTSAKGRKGVSGGRASSLAAARAPPAAMLPRRRAG